MRRASEAGKVAESELGALRASLASAQADTAAGLERAQEQWRLDHALSTSQLHNQIYELERQNHVQANELALLKESGAKGRVRGLGVRADSVCRMRTPWGAGRRRRWGGQVQVEHVNAALGTTEAALEQAQDELERAELKVRAAAGGGARSTSWT